MGDGDRSPFTLELYENAHSLAIRNGRNTLVGYQRRPVESLEEAYKWVRLARLIRLRMVRELRPKDLTRLSIWHKAFDHKMKTGVR